MTSGDATKPTGPVLVGYDGEGPSKLALEHALREAQERGVEVVILVVAGIPLQTVDTLEPGIMDVGYIPPIPEDGPIEIQSILADARSALEAAPVEGTVEWSLGDPAGELIRVAEEQGAGAIVVGAHHHSALARLFGADTAAELVRSAPCEVIVAR